jgi:hypothetical protein
MLRRLTVMWHSSFFPRVKEMKDFGTNVYSSNSLLRLQTLQNYEADHSGRRDLRHELSTLTRNTGILCSNSTKSMHVCVYSVFVLCCVGNGLATG